MNSPSANTCAWIQDWEGAWETQCGGLFTLTEGAPSDNSMNFCCYCGQKIEEVKCPQFDETEASNG